MTRAGPCCVFGAVFLLWYPAAGFELEPVADGVLVHVGRHEEFSKANRGDIANLGVVIGRDAVAVIDTGGSLAVGEAFRSAIAEHTDVPVRYVINTHFHPDHVLGNGAFDGPEVTFVGHPKLPQALAERGPFYRQRLADLMGDDALASDVVLASHLIEDRETIDLGDRVIELRSWPTGHTSADLTVLDRQTGTLFAGDLLFMQRLPVVDGSLLGWLDLLAELAGLKAVRVVPGHGPASAPWPDALSAQKRYLEKLRDGVRDAIARNVPLAKAENAVPLDERENWMLADENHPRNVITSYTELEWE